MKSEGLSKQTAWFFIHSTLTIYYKGNVNTVWLSPPVKINSILSLSAGPINLN